VYIYKSTHSQYVTVTWGHCYVEAGISGVVSSPAIKQDSQSVLIKLVGLYICDKICSPTGWNLGFNLFNFKRNSCFLCIQQIRQIENANSCVLPNKYCIDITCIIRPYSYFYLWKIILKPDFLFNFLHFEKWSAILSSFNLTIYQLSVLFYLNIVHI